MAVIIRPVDSAAELVTAFDVAGAQFDPAIDHTDQRRFAELEAAYPGERELLLVAEESGSVAGAAMGFVSTGPEVTLRILAVAAEPVKDMTWHRSSFGGVPQRFVDLDEPSPAVPDQVQDLLCGAHVGYCMTKAINTRNEPAMPGLG